MKKIQDIIKDEDEFVGPKNIVIKESEDSSEYIREPGEDFHTHEYYIDKKRVRLKILLWVLCFVSIASLIYFLLDKFSTAKVTITAKEEPFSLEENPFFAIKGIYSSLGYELMSVSAEEKIKITMTESSKEESRARGKVVFYNAYSSKADKLSKGTKVVNTDDHVYLLESAISIPGFTKDKSGKVIPGSTTAYVVAPEVGDSHNSEPQDFTVVNYAKSAKASKIYGRSDGPITGGFSGLAYTLTPEEKGRLHSDATISLKNKLIRKIKAEVPPGYILYENSLKFSIDTSIIDSFKSKDQITSITFKGSAYSPIFRKDNLEKFLVSYINKDIKDSEARIVKVVGLDTLNLIYKEIPFEIAKNSNRIDFAFTGEGKLLWYPDVDYIKSQLVNMHENYISDILKDIHGVASANLRITPAYKHFLPSATSRIKVIIPNN